MPINREGEFALVLPGLFKEVLCNRAEVAAERSILCQGRWTPAHARINKRHVCLGRKGPPEARWSAGIQVFGLALWALTLLVRPSL